MQCVCQKDYPFSCPLAFTSAHRTCSFVHSLYFVILCFGWLGLLVPLVTFSSCVWPLYWTKFPIYVLLNARSDLQQLLNIPQRPSSFAPPILPCRSRTQLDQLMRLGILQIHSPVFDNYTEFGWPGLQCWSWKCWWSTDPHPISYEWYPQGSWFAYGLHGHWTCWTEDRSSTTAQDGSLLEMLCSHPTWKSNLLCWRHRTWTWSCLLPVEQDEEPPWIVG